MIEQLHFPLEADQGYRFVVEDIQIKMKLLTKSLHYEPIKLALESTAFGADTLEDLASCVVDWVKLDFGVIANALSGRLRIITKSVVITGKVVDPGGQVLSGQKIEDLFVRPFTRGEPKMSVYMLKDAYAGHMKAVQAHFLDPQNIQV